MFDFLKLTSTNPGQNGQNTTSVEECARGLVKNKSAEQLFKKGLNRVLNNVNVEQRGST